MITAYGTRELLVRFQRDPAGDCCRDGLAFRGFRFFWPDGRPLRTGLSRLCGVGTALFFGRRRPVPDECLLRLCCAATSEDAPPRRPAPGVRVLRLYLQREGSRGVLHFHNGLRTEVVFEDGVDEPRVLRWVGMDGLADGGRVWLDLFALPCGRYPGGDSVPTGAGTAPSGARPVHLGASPSTAQPPAVS